jgi:hypothetical protein
MTKVSRYTLTKVKADAIPAKFVLGAVTSNLESALYFSMELKEDPDKKTERITLNVEYQNPSKEKELSDFLVSLSGYDFSYELIDFNTIMGRETKSESYEPKENDGLRGSH